MIESLEFLWSLTKLSFGALWPQMGTNGFGGMLLFVVPLLVVVVNALFAPRDQKWATIVRRWKEELLGTFIVLILVVGNLFMWELLWNQPNTIRRQADSIPPPGLPKAPYALEENGLDDSLIQAEIESIKKQLQSMSPPMSSAAFSVKAEFGLISPGGRDKFTSLLVGYKDVSGYVLYPVTHFLFVRITNLLPVRTMIERLQVTMDSCGADERLDMTTGGEVFTTTQRDSLGSPAIGRTLLFKDNGTGRALVLFDVKGVDLSRSARLNMPLLDRVVSQRYFNPGESVGGWILFNSTCMGFAEKFTIEDIAGRTFKYQDNGRNEMMSGDVSANKAITIAEAVDLSGSIIRTTQ
jgi:hypothetical protein